MRNILFFPALIAAGILGCSPSPNDNTQLNTNIPPQFYRNISTLYGAGYPVAKDSTGFLKASDIQWKDSLGVSHSLVNLKDTIIILNFWATWCEYCTYEMPDMQAVSDSMGKYGVRVIGVSIDAGNSIFDLVKEYVKEHNISYQIVIDPKETTYLNYHGGTGIPVTFIIDRQGNISTKFIGQTNKKDVIEYLYSIL
ncbi:MAG TPA: TlpA disulfide reductase family protein [Candidatus Kapabacteria bacterium]|nr:TlpA disulfide reductase family protein [Candidatus Kapabacteria bacterium]